MGEVLKKDTEKNEVVVTKDDIVKGLRGLGLKKGDIIGVHSSLSAFGYVEGGADAVVDALIEVVGEEGAVVVPTYSVNRQFIELTPWDRENNVAWKLRFSEYDPATTPCWTGIIPETLRKRPGAVRGSHISHSLAAIGKNAAELCQGWDKLYEYDGYILLLGVLFNRCSSLHLAEQYVTLPEDILESITLTQEQLEKYPKPEWEVYRHPYPSFEYIDEPCRRAGILKMTKIGNAEIRLVRLRELIDLYIEELKTNPYTYYRLKKNR